MSVPLHVVPDSPTHGVGLLARQVAGEVGAETVTVTQALTLRRRRVHVHVSDSAFAATCEDAADLLVAVGRRHRTTLTLHDVPQPLDGPVYRRRATAYARVVAAADGWVTSSHHEAGLALRHLGGPRAEAVIPLPVMVRPGGGGPRARRAPGGGAVVGVLGWVYPGKGHAEVLQASGALVAHGAGPVEVRALGAVAAAHEPLVSKLHALAERLGVGLEVSGWMDEVELDDAMRSVDVPVAAHLKVSASGSINSWLAAGRRPLVRDGAYVRELGRRHPSALHLIAPGGFADGFGRALADPTSTWLPAGAMSTWGLAEVGAAYRHWWASR